MLVFNYVTYLYIYIQFIFFFFEKRKLILYFFLLSNNTFNLSRQNRWLNINNNFNSRIKLQCLEKEETYTYHMLIVGLACRVNLIKVYFQDNKREERKGK